MRRPYRSCDPLKSISWPALVLPLQSCCWYVQITSPHLFVVLVLPENFNGPHDSSSSILSGINSYPPSLGRYNAASVIENATNTCKVQLAVHISQLLSKYQPGTSNFSSLSFRYACVRVSWVFFLFRLNPVAEYYLPQYFHQQPAPAQLTRPL